MTKTAHQVEKNVSASFGYVKKDILMLNDAISDIHDKIQHLSLNNATLLAEVEMLRADVKGKAKAKPKAKPQPKKKAAPKKKVAKKTVSKKPKKVVTETVVY